MSTTDADEKKPLVADVDGDDDNESSDAQPSPAPVVRSAPAPPAAWKRVLLVLFVVALCLVAFRLRLQGSAPRKPPVVHAQRYNKQYKYRPAASPIVTQKLPDGRTRVRGDDVRRIREAEARRQQ